MIKAIIWDFGGVLGAYIGNIHFWKNIKGTKELRDEFGTGKISTEEFVERGRKFLNMNKENFVRGYEDYVSVKLNPAVFEIYKKIKLDRYIFSDVNPIAQEQRARDFKEVFDLAKCSFLSPEIKMRKSSIETFKFVIKKINKEPEEILFIDDMQEHLDKAKSLGINTILYQNPKQLKSDLKKFGVLV